MNDEFKFYALYPQDGRLMDFGENLDEFIATLYLHIYNLHKDWAKAQSRDARFYIDYRHFTDDDSFIPCICVAAGFFDLALAKIYGAKITDVQNAFKIRRETLERLNNKTENYGYAA